jgi:hypothetical protein
VAVAGDIVTDRDNLAVEDRIGVAVVDALRQHGAVGVADDDGADRIEGIAFGPHSARGSGRLAAHFRRHQLSCEWAYASGITAHVEVEVHALINHGAPTDDYMSDPCIRFADLFNVSKQRGLLLIVVALTIHTSHFIYRAVSHYPVPKNATSKGTKGCITVIRRFRARRDD